MHRAMLPRFTFAVALLPLVSLSVGCSAGTDSSSSPPGPAPTSTTGDPPPPPPVTPPRDLPPGYADALAQTIDEIDSRTGLGPDFKVDVAKLKSDALALLQTGGKTADDGLWLAIRSVEAAYPAGHLQVYPSAIKTCGTAALPMQSSSFVGACTQPFADHAVVTSASPGNELGLAPGDEIVAIDGKSGAAMLDAAFAKPMCGTASPSASHRRALSATSLFAAVAVGTTVTIKHPSGATETKTVAKLGAPLSCHDPLGRHASYVAQGTIRPDGAGVLHIPSFSPASFDESNPQKSIDDFIDAIKVEFDKVKDAPELVIDVRGNPGGITLAGLAIAQGMPGAKAMKLAHCQARIAGTSDYDEDFDYELVPDTKFAYAGKVAVLADGLSFSASDYFVRAMKLGTSTIVVGRPEAGAYGGSTDEVKITKGPGLVVYPDPWRCTDPSGAALESHSIVPDVEQDLVPADLAKGIDSDVETALATLRGGK
jgi:C-terminal processing protease CtpA/Prc